MLKNCRFNEIIYVSCNPVTLARDLKQLKNNYGIKEARIFDMFAQSYHTETVIKLERLKNA